VGHPPGRRTELGLGWDRRQWAIFQHIRLNYPVVALAVGGDRPSTQQRRFRTEANAYGNPDNEGFNKWNSLRIDRLYNALDELAPAAALRTDEGAAELLAAVNALRKSDAQYILDPGQASKLRGRIGERLAPDSALKNEILDILEAKEQGAGS
jgi:hypothetical protein